MRSKWGWIVRLLLIFLVITALLWVVDSSGLTRPGWRLLPKLPVTLIRAEHIVVGSFYSYSIIAETDGQKYECRIFRDETCIWKPIEAIPLEDVFSVPFTSTSAECAKILPLAARLRLGDRQVASCATSDVWGEFFDTYSVAIIADTQGDFWVIHYGYSLPLLLCSPIPFGLPLLITVIITGMLDSKKIYRWIQAKKAASSELPKT